MPQSMTALFGGCGPDWQARQVPVPDPGPEQVLVRAHAVSVNNADITDPSRRCRLVQSSSGYSTRRQWPEPTGK
jgi:hypothetical protein